MVVPEEYGSYCKSSSSAYMPPIVPLTYNWTTLTDAIGKLQPTGNTNQGIGLAWGWLTLGVGKAPFNAPAKDTDNYDYTDAIVLLSDGLNTQNRWTSDPAKIDDREEKMCAAAKAAPNNITIYTVQVNTGGDKTSQVLKDCASSADKFYLITDPDKTVSVFNSIGQSLSKLRVSL